MAIMFLTIDVLASKKIHIILIFWAIGILQKCKKSRWGLMLYYRGSQPFLHLVPPNDPKKICVSPTS
jgi:hypothetical protein